MLEQLSRKDAKWRAIAFNICKDKELSDDLVQEMYVKIYNISLKKELFINDAYVVRIMINIFKDYCKENKKKISIEYLQEIEAESNRFEPDDEEKHILDNLTYLEREILTQKESKSYHAIQREFNINYQFARRIVIEAQKKYGKKKKK